MPQSRLPRFLPAPGEMMEKESMRCVVRSMVIFGSGGHILRRVLMRRYGLRLWSKVTDAIVTNNQQRATDEKIALEEEQRTVRCVGGPRAQSLLVLPAG